ncbi:MAG: DUF1122 domain-containing protein [Proteobacteria bacterium]|nr:DUF1122 domain-containing protein [Pseudomonadota bacterium]
MINSLPLTHLSGRSVGQFQIEIESKPLEYRRGWTHFALYLRDQQGRPAAQAALEGGYVVTPVLEGIHSRGGRSVRGWIEIGDYYPVVHFIREAAPPISLDLSKGRMDQQIFELLSETIPPGGHLMFAYEVSYESPFHRETQAALMKGVPPVCTTQGEILFRSGFRLVKDWYLAEGGHEGPRKLWGEKPSNDAESLAFDLRTFLQILGFLSRKPSPADIELELRGRRRALGVLGELELQSPLLDLKKEVIHIYHGCSRTDDLEVATYRTCQSLESMIEISHFEDENTRMHLSEISEACAERVGRR